MKCPYCGKAIFENNAPTLTPQRVKHHLLDDVVAFGGTMALATIGTYGIVWHSGLEWYWLAPFVGVASALGLATLKTMILRPPGPKRPQVKGVTIDVKERREGGGSLFLNTFPKCRPSQLVKFANAAINHDCPVSRREMARFGVSEGQWSNITKAMVEKHWLEVLGDTDNANRQLNFMGRRVLRGLLYSPLGQAYRPQNHPTSTTPPPPHH